MNQCFGSNTFANMFTSKWFQNAGFQNAGIVSWRSDFFIPKKYFSFEKIQKYFWDFFQNIFFNFWVDLFRKSYLPTFLLKYFEIMLKKYHFQKKMFPQKNQWKISSYFWFSRKAKYVRLEGRRVRPWMRICEIWPAAKLTNSNSELSVILVRSVDVQKHTNVRCFSTDSSVDKQPFLERTRRIPRIPLYFIKVFS